MSLWVNGNGKIIQSTTKIFECADCPCGTCCLYSATGWFASDFSRDDLPDEILIDGSSATKTSSGTVLYSGSASLREEGGFAYTAFPSGGNPGISISPFCLIGTYNRTEANGGPFDVEDLFSDTLTVNSTDTLTRQTLCKWTGAKSGGGTWTLQYDSVAYVWKLDGTAKSGDQNTPAGTYGSDTVA